MAQVGYVSVSTAVQDGALQRDALTKAGCGRFFEDKASGIKIRTGLRTMSLSIWLPSATHTSTCGGSSHSPSKRPPRASSCRNEARSLQKAKEKLILELNQ